MQRTINGLNVFLHGNPTNTPIIFVHGFPYDHSMWNAQVEALSGKYYCIVYDVRGLGTSHVGDGQFTMEMFVDDLEIIVNELRLQKAVLCGLSMGGYISLRASEKMQEKFHSLILCDTKSIADDNEGKLKRAAAIRQINSGEFDEFIESFVLNCFGNKFVKEDKAEFRAVVERSKKNSPVGVKGCLLAMLSRTDTTQSLSKIDIPTLIICGSEDKLSPPDIMKSMSGQIPNSEFILVKDAGHMTPIEAPEFVNKAVKDFLIGNKI